MLARDDLRDRPGEDGQRAGDPERPVAQQRIEDEVEAGGEQHRADRDEQIVAAADQPQVLVVLAGRG